MWNYNKGAGKASRACSATAFAPMPRAMGKRIRMGTYKGTTLKNKPRPLPEQLLARAIGYYLMQEEYKYG